MANAKSENAQGIKIITHGQYYYKTETAKGVKNFSITVRSASLEMFRETSQKYIGPDDNGRAMFRTNTYLNIRGQLKKRLLPILLRRKFSDFARVRFVSIDEIVSENGKALELPVNLRSRAQLEEMIRDEKMPIDSSEYLEVDDLRTDILEYIQSPEVFLASKPVKDRRRQEEREFMRLNDLGGETLPPVRESREQKPERPAVAPGVLDD